LLGPGQEREVGKKMSEVSVGNRLGCETKKDKKDRRAVSSPKRKWVLRWETRGKTAHCLTEDGACLVNTSPERKI